MERETKIAIGDVLICKSNQGNPYHGEADVDRPEALRAFRDGKLPIGLIAWYAPGGGGAYVLKDPDAVDWRGLRNR